MRKMRILITALLAVALIADIGSTIMAPSMSMFSAPDLSIKNLGFGQISSSQVGKEPIIFAPQNILLMRGAELAPNIKPRLMTNNWSASMKGSSINQMFALMSTGLGSKNGVPTGHHTGV